MISLAALIAPINHAVAAQPPIQSVAELQSFFDQAYTNEAQAIMYPVFSTDAVFHITLGATSFAATNVQDWISNGWPSVTVAFVRSPAALRRSIEPILMKKRLALLRRTSGDGMCFARQLSHKNLWDGLFRQAGRTEYRRYFRDGMLGILCLITFCAVGVLCPTTQLDRRRSPKRI